MAQETARIRWPRIVNDMIEDVQKTVEEGMHPGSVEGAGVAHALEILKQDIVHDRPLQGLPESSIPDRQWWNNQIQKEDGMSWHDAPWLFAECYLYCRVQHLFLETEYWQQYDIFARQKKSTFLNSQKAVDELASRYADTISNPEHQKLSSDQRFALFSEMMQVALWGNATDLSLLAQLSLEDLQSLQGRKSIQESQQNIVDNDIPEVWSYLTSKDYLGSEQQIDIVLDNSGFELFTDLVFAAYLLERKIASSIRLHVKDFPWFVSDAMRSDVEWLLQALKSEQNFPRSEGIDMLCGHLTGFLKSDKITIISNWFWTTGSSYHELPERAPALLDQLKTSDLVIFKGDLHYRKLTNDGLWPHLTSFQQALGPLAHETGLSVLSLRTNKADVCVGIESEARLDELNKICPNGGWVRNGKFAVVSFNRSD